MNAKQITLFVIAIVALAVIYVPIQYEKIQKTTGGDDHPDVSIPSFFPDASDATSTGGSEPALAYTPLPDNAEQGPTSTQQTSTIKQTESAWVIQVGSFDDQQNAMALKDKLTGQNLDAFISDVQSDDGSTKYRVLVGPELSKDDADALKQSLQDKFQLQGVVMAYQPASSSSEGS